MVERLSTTVEYLDMNVTKKPLDDVRVRQAIDYAINEQAIEDIVYRGTASYSPTTVTPGMKYFDDSDTDYRYDVKKAKQLLKEAGVSDLKLTLICSESELVLMRQQLFRVCCQTWVLMWRFSLMSPELSSI